MPYKIQFLDNENGIVTTFSGTVTDEDLIKSIEERISPEERFKKLVYAIADYSDVTKYEISSDAMRKAAAISVKASTLNNELFLIGIVPTDLEFGMGRMWQAYVDDTNWRTKLVRSREEAKQWLKSQIPE
jgi:hypothetical protein